MRKIAFVKQFTDEAYNPNSVICVVFKRERGCPTHINNYGIYNIPKYVKRYMMTHKCRKFADRDTGNPQTFIYGEVSYD